MLTFLEQCQKAWENSGQSGTGLPTAVTGQTGKEKEIVDAVIFSNTYLQAYQNWNWQFKEISSFTLVADQERYTAVELVAGTNTVLRAYNIESFYLTPDGGTRGKLNREKHREVWKQSKAQHSGVSSGPPTQFHMFPNRDIEFGPFDMTAGHILEFEYWRKGIDLGVELTTTNTDLDGNEIVDGTLPDAEMDDEYDDVIWQMASMLISERVSAVERSEALRAWLAEWLAMMGRDNQDEIAFAQSELLNHQAYFGDQT